MNKRITPPSDFNFNLFNVDELADYFSNKTYPEITETLAVIDTHIKTARKVDCKIHPEVKLINKVFRELKQALEKGMLKEERFFLPVVKKIGQAQKKRDYDLIDDILLIDGTLDELMAEHRRIKQLLAQINLLCATNPLSVNSSPSLKSFYSEIVKLEEQIQKHFFVEDEIFISKLGKIAIFLEESNLVTLDNVS